MITSRRMPYDIEKLSPRKKARGLNAKTQDIHEKQSRRSETVVVPLEGETIKIGHRSHTRRRDSYRVTKDNTVLPKP